MSNYIPSIAILAIAMERIRQNKTKPDHLVVFFFFNYKTLILVIKVFLISFRS